MATLSLSVCAKDFWRFWNNFEIGKFPEFSNLRLFKKGVKPKWEDGANKLGGKFMVNVAKGQSTRVFLELVLALVGEEFPHNDSVCGIVLSIRPRQDVLAIWNSSADDAPAMESIRAELDRLFPADAQVNYVPHSAGAGAKPVLVPLPRGKHSPSPSQDNTAAVAAAAAAAAASVTPKAAPLKSTTPFRQTGRSTASPSPTPMAGAPTTASVSAAATPAHRRSISYSGPTRRSARKRSVDLTRLANDEPDESESTFEERLLRNVALTASAGPGRTLQSSNGLEIFEPDEIAGDGDDDDDLRIPASRHAALADTNSRFKWQRLHEQATGGATTRRRSAAKSAGVLTTAETVAPSAPAAPAAPAAPSSSEPKVAVAVAAAPASLSVALLMLALTVLIMW